MGSFGVTGHHDEARASGSGVTVGRSGASFGVVSFCDRDYWPLNTCLYATDFHGNDPRFAYYLLKSIDFGRYNSGSAQPSLNRNFIRDIPVRVPPLPEQRHIARTLGGLDDKIELNLRMNRTLESIARAIFKSWFVDFDPVRRKMEGGEVGLPLDLDSLFPGSFEPSSLGPLPSGWKISEIGQEVSVVGGSTPSTGVLEYWNGDVHFATPRDLAALSSPVLLETERLVTQAGAATISSGILSPGAVLMSSRAPIGYLAINEVPVCVNQGFVAMKCDRSLPNFYVLHWARSNMDAIVGNANGTTFLEISKRNFRPLPVVVPPESLLRRFLDVAKSLHERVVVNLRDNIALAEMRDAVLPRLVSGHLRVLSGVHDRQSGG
jgi:type I restriction enzyme S subunit